MNQSLEKSLKLLEALATDAGRCSLQTIAAEQCIPLPTAWRLAATLERSGYLQRGVRGRYLPGMGLRNLAQTVSELDVIAAVSRPMLCQLAAKFECVAHLGMLEDDMVTYRARAGADTIPVPTREGTQLEAYCSAIGKVLLAEESEEAIASYLGSAPFVALTRWTITDPSVLRAELRIVAAQGYAVDAREIRDDLTCIASPVRDGDGTAIAAISLSQAPAQPSSGQQKAMLRQLQQVSKDLGKLIGEVT